MLTGYSRPKKAPNKIPSGSLVVRNITRQTVLMDGGRIADNPATRVKGLLKDTHLKPGDGLWIVPCSSIHSIGMQFNFDAVFLDRQLRVIHLITNMKPWQFSYQFLPLCGIGVLELPAFTIQATQTELKDQLEFSAKA